MRRQGGSETRRGAEGHSPFLPQPQKVRTQRNFGRTILRFMGRTSLVSSLLVCVCVCVQPESKQHAIHYVSIGDYGSGNWFTVEWKHFVMSEVWRVVEFFCAVGKVSFADMKFRCYFTD